MSRLKKLLKVRLSSSPVVVVVVVEVVVVEVVVVEVVVVEVVVVDVVVVEVVVVVVVVVPQVPLTQPSDASQIPAKFLRLLVRKFKELCLNITHRSSGHSTDGARAQSIWHTVPTNRSKLVIR